MELKKHSVLSNIWYFIKILAKNEPIVIVLSIVQIVVQIVAPLIGIYFPKIAIDMVTEKIEVNQAILILSICLVIAMVIRCINSLAFHGKFFYYNDQRGYLMGLLFLKSLRVDYEQAESGEAKKIYWKAYDDFQNGDGSCINQMIVHTIQIIVSIVCFVLYSAIIGYLNLFLFLIILANTFIIYYITQKYTKYKETLRPEQAENRKHFQTIRSSAENVKGAKDIRIFNMNRWIIQLRDIVLDDMNKLRKRQANKQAFYERIKMLVNTVKDLCVYGYLLYEAIEGDITAGDFVLFLGAINGFSSFINSIIGSYSQLKYSSSSTDYIRTYLSFPECDVNKGNRHISELETPLKIEFKNVSFSYKDGEKENKVFDNFNLTINSGEKIALVGVNGAGKTTLVKLLCGMYKPQNGEILINGINTADFPKQELYELFSVVFQETLILPFTIGENIAMARAEKIDTEKAWEALEKAGLKETLEKDDIKLNRYMTRRLMKNGISLSGGQQQRLMLARALYKNAPILVLDEPTAALDPIAESEIYDSYAKYTDGKTALFISHRLASTRFSDRIVMIEDGKIVDMGTHDELIEKDGAYAQMFKVQSNYYQDGEEE